MKKVSYLLNCVLVLAFIRLSSSEDCGCGKLNRDKSNLVSKSNGEHGICDTESKCPPASSGEQVEAEAVDDGDDGDVELEVEDEFHATEAHETPEKMEADTADTLSILKSNKMINVPGGRFSMGTENPYLPQDGEGPMREAEVDEFYIDTQEVSNREFDAFVRETNYKTEVSIIHFPIINQLTMNACCQPVRS